MANGDLTTEDIERQQATLETQQQDIVTRRQQLQRRRQQLRDPGLREPGETRQLGQEQQRREQLSQQISSLREAEQEIETQQQELEQAKTKDIGGIELPRGANIETFAAQVEQRVERGDPISEAIATQGAVNIQPGDELTSQQRETAQDLIEFEQEREQRREEQQEREELREAIEDQSRDELVRETETGTVVTFAQVDGEEIPVTEQTAQELEQEDVDVEFIDRATAQAGTTPVVPGVGEQGQLPDDIDVKTRPIDPIQTTDAPLFENVLTQSAAEEGRLFQEPTQPTGIDRIEQGVTTLGRTAAQGLSDIDRFVEFQIGRALPGPNPFQGPRPVREQQRTATRALRGAEQIGTGVQDLFPSETIASLTPSTTEQQREQVAQLALDTEQVNVTDEQRTVITQRAGEAQAGQLQTGLVEAGVGEAGEFTGILAGTPGVIAATATDIQERGVELGTESLRRATRRGLGQQFTALQQQPREAAGEVVAEGLGLAIGSPFIPTVEGTPVTTQIGRAGEAVSDSFVRETVQNIEEVPRTVRDPAREIQEIPGGFTLSEEVQDPTVPLDIEQGGLTTTRQVTPEQTPPQIRRIRTRELPLVPERLTRRQVTEDVFFEDEGFGPLVRERRVVERLPNRDDIVEFLQPRQRRKGQLSVEQTVTPDKGQVREQFFGQDIRQVPEPDTTTVPTSPQRLLAPSIQALQVNGGPGLDTGLPTRQERQLRDVTRPRTQPGVDVTPQVSPQERTVPDTQLQTDTRQRSQLQAEFDTVTPFATSIDLQQTVSETPVPTPDTEPSPEPLFGTTEEDIGDLEEEFRASLAGIELGIEEEEAPDVATGLGIRGLTR